MASQLAIIGGSASAPALPEQGFALPDMAIFTAIPAHGYGIVALRGMVAVYDTESLHREEIQEGGFYVRETQSPSACMSWENWLRREAEEYRRRVGPSVPLRIRREVVQPIHWPYADDWALRLESGWVDGPYHGWAFGCDLVGKVVGLFLPDREA